jgi:hypothetical protein
MVWAWKLAESFKQKSLVSHLAKLQLKTHKDKSSDNTDTDSDNSDDDSNNGDDGDNIQDIWYNSEIPKPDFNNPDSDNDEPDFNKAQDTKEAPNELLAKLVQDKETFNWLMDNIKFQDYYYYFNFKKQK